MANSSLFYPPAAYPPTPDTMRNNSNNMSHAQRYQYEDAPLEAGVSQRHRATPAAQRHMEGHDAGSHGASAHCKAARMSHRARC
jgi:hypothetical protein